jgi:8-hydroxy-5-deazaflavin:NADPH oxidoreductase
LTIQFGGIVLEKMKIAIIGGTGNEGKGLAYRWAKFGHQVIIGSRNLEKARNAVLELRKLLTDTVHLESMENITACRDAEIIVLTVPYSAHRDTLETIKEVIKGKMFIDVTVPLIPPKVSKVQMPDAGSALKEAKLILGEAVRVSSAFQNISHELLLKDNPIECDVLVCGEDKETRSIVLQLVADAGLQGYDAGPIENSVVVEGLTSILIGLNIQNKVHSAGIRITGIPRNNIL